MTARKVLILQGILPDYRRPVFNRLADFYDVTIAHSGPSGLKQGDRFKELILPVKAVGRFKLHRPGLVSGLMAQADATIAMFDLAWPAYILPALGIGRPRRFVLWGHRYSASALANNVREALMRRADRVLMYGDHHNARLIAAGIDPQRIVVAHNTMDISNHADFSEHAKDSILFVGRLQDRKRLDVALEAFASLIGRIPGDVMFDIVGDGEPRARLEAQAQALGIADRVRFHGAIRDDELLAQRFARALVYISPGDVGLSVLHSFAYGVPVITYREGHHGPEFHNMVDSENSIIVEPDEDFAERLGEIIQDRDAARRLGSNAYRHYSVERTIDVMIDGFRRAIEG